MTGGTDKVVKIWNVDQSEGGKPSVSMVASRDLDIVRGVCFVVCAIISHE